MVTCTRAYCYGSEACDCVGSRSKKRRRADAANTSYPRKTRKIRTNCAHPRADSYTTNRRGNIRGRGQICPSIDADAIDREAQYSGNAACLPNSNRSDSTSHQQAWSCSAQGCPHSCINTCICTLVSPNLRGQEYEQNSTIMARAKYDICKYMESCTDEAEIRILRPPTTLNEVVVHIGEAGHAQELPLEDERSEDNKISSTSDRVTALGPSIPPPTNPSTPPEYVAEVSYDPEFLQKFIRAYDTSQYSDTLRAHKYGDHVATEYRRGFTPEEYREEWQLLAKQSKADADAGSDSEGYECV